MSRIKKYLPLILIGLGLIIVVVVAVILFRAMRGPSGGAGAGETSVPELPQSEWPAVSLTPTDNPAVSGSLGHWLDFKVENINVPGAATMDYLLVYYTSDGGQQGVPGTVKLTGGDIERKLLLGSESSGKFRYDSGVSQGSITITFRDANGKTMGKLSTDFSLQSGVTSLSSVDGSFKYMLSKLSKSVYFVTMKTFIQPKTSANTVIWQNGYGVFSSDGKPHTGNVGQ